MAAATCAASASPMTMVQFVKLMFTLSHTTLYWGWAAAMGATDGAHGARRMLLLVMVVLVLRRSCCCCWARGAEGEHRCDSFCLC